jgi:hypothetical protein
MPLTARRWLLAASVCLLMVAPGVAQSDGPYLALVDAYARGDLHGSVAQLAEWSEARVRAAVRTAAVRPSLQRAKAAAMLHTETAFAIIAVRPSSATLHLATARTFVHQIPEGRTSTDRSSEFKQRWNALAVGPYLSQDLLAQAQQEIRTGFDEYPGNKELELAVGVVEEMRAQFAEPNLRGSWNTARADRGPVNYRNSVQPNVEAMLTRATVAYRRALGVDQHYLEVRLRLGWVLLLNHSAGPARAQLEEVRARATRSDLRYLAHLFVGAVDEHDRRIEDAVHEYEAAHDIAPAWQTASIALIRVERALGHGDRAREVAAAYAALPRTAADDDPWWRYNMGETSGELVEWLRAEAERR